MASSAGVSDVYLDNFRIAGTLQECELGRDRLRDAFTQAGVTADPNPWPIEHEYDFLGIHFMHKTSEVGITQRIRTKVQNACCFPRTLRDLLSTVGLLVFAGRVLGLSLAKRFPIFKFMRRRSSYDLDAEVDAWQCVSVTLQEWVGEVLTANPRRVVTHSDNKITLFTDASLSGWGAFWFKEGTGSSTGGDYDTGEACGCFTNPEPIVRLEARALLYGIRAAPKAQFLVLCIDNQPLVGALRKSSSREYHLNRIVGQIVELLSECYEAWEVNWIPSAHNYADGLSRGKLARL
jgi:hypothetical protein